MTPTQQLSASLQPNQTDINRFAEELKRVLYVAQMLTTYTEWLRMDKVSPSWLKVDLKNIQNSIARLYADVQRTASNEAEWNAIRADLDSDQLADLAELIDVCSNIKNLSGMVEIIKESKKECTEL